MKDFLKKKGLVVPINCGVPYENIVIKRTEERFESSTGEVLSELRKTTSEEGVRYRGRIRKEKGDVFILDTNDGRIYSFTITRAHLTKDGDAKESGIQRQLEIEYAGYVPGFKGFEKESEPQIVRGMVDMAKYTFAMYNGAPIRDGWRMNLALTSERKYDFVLGESRKQMTLPMPRKLLETTFA
jgi:hypothetical protein